MTMENQPFRDVSPIEHVGFSGRVSPASNLASNLGLISMLKFQGCFQPSDGCCGPDSHTLQAKPETGSRCSELFAMMAIKGG